VLSWAADVSNGGWCDAGNNDGRLRTKRAKQVQLWWLLLLPCGDAPRDWPAELELSPHDGWIALRDPPCWSASLTKAEAAAVGQADFPHSGGILLLPHRVSSALHGLAYILLPTRCAAAISGPDRAPSSSRLPQAVPRQLSAQHTRRYLVFSVLLLIRCVVCLQGIDLLHGGRQVGHKNRKVAETGNVYVRLLAKLYSFLSRRTDSGFNAVVLKRLIMSRTNRPPMGLARIQRYMKGQESKIAVVVSTVTDDVRLDGHAYPGMKIAALRFTEGARARITKAGGECLTFDQLALLRPRGENTVLLRGRRNARVATRYFGTPGASGSTTRPRIESKGRKVCHADSTRSLPRACCCCRALPACCGRLQQAMQQCAKKPVCLMLPSYLHAFLLSRLSALQFEKARGRRKSRGFKV